MCLANPPAAQTWRRNHADIQRACPATQINIVPKLLATTVSWRSGASRGVSVDRPIASELFRRKSLGGPGRTGITKRRPPISSLEGHASSCPKMADGSAARRQTFGQKKRESLRHEKDFVRVGILHFGAG